MVQLGSFSNFGWLDAPAVLPTIAVADPGAEPGGGPPSPPVIISRSGSSSVLGGSMRGDIQGWAYGPAGQFWLLESALSYPFVTFSLQIIDGVRDEMNRLYNMFCSRNPSFLEKGGKISILAHSLGSVIAYDILTLWDIELRHLSHDSTTGTGFLTESLHYLRSVTSRGSVEGMETSAEGKRKENLRVELAKARSQVMKLEAMIASEVEHESHVANNGSNECPYALKFKVCMVKLCYD